MTDPIETRPPLPPFTRETAIQIVRAAEDGWNTRDPERVSLAYTKDSVWRNRAEFTNGRAEIVGLLRARHEIRVSQLPDSLDPEKHDVSATGTELTRELIVVERKFIHQLLRDGRITDETRRRIERDLDLEEASLANREYRQTPL